MSTSKWRDKTGKMVEIVEMSDDHIINAIKYLEKKSKKYKKVAIEVLSLECDMVNSAAENVIDEESVMIPLMEVEKSIDIVEGLSVDEIWPVYSKLVMEAKNRGLLGVIR